VAQRQSHCGDERVGAFIDVLIGNEEDFQKVLGFKVEGVDESLKTLPVEGYKKMVEQVVGKFPTFKRGYHAARGGERTREQLVGDSLFRRGVLPIQALRRPGDEDRVGAATVFCSGASTPCLREEAHRKPWIWARRMARCCNPPAVTPA